MDRGKEVLEQITALTVAYKTPELMNQQMSKFRKFYPDISLIIINNSPLDDGCTEVLEKLARKDKNIRLFHTKRNIGHGYGLNVGFKYITTPFAYIFDSDSIMMVGGIFEAMLKVMKPNVYGCGFVLITGRGGGGTKQVSKNGVVAEGEMYYLHPLACMISCDMFWKYPPYNSFGAPFCETMTAIWDTGKAKEMIIDFPVFKYIHHISGGTRALYGPYESMLKDHDKGDEFEFRANLAKSKQDS